MSIQAHSVPLKEQVESCRQLGSGTVKCDIFSGVTNPSKIIIVLSISVKGGAGPCFNFCVIFK